MNNFHCCVWSLVTDATYTNCVCLIGALTGVVGVLSVLLFISLTINLLCTIYCIYQLKMKTKQRVVSEGEKQDALYEQVDEQQQFTATRSTLAMKQNEAYGKISSQTSNPSHSTGL